MVRVGERRWGRDTVWRSWERWCGVVCTVLTLGVDIMLIDTGHGAGIVVGTGKDSEFGVIFSMMQDVSCHSAFTRTLPNCEQVEEKRTPLQLLMDDLAKRLSIFSFVIIGIIVVVGVLQKRDWLEMFTIGGKLSCHAWRSV